MVEFRINDVLGGSLRNAYQKLGSCKMSAKAYYSYTKIGEWLGKVSKEGRSKYMELVKKFATLDEEGNPKESEGKWDIAEDKMSDFNAAMVEFMQEKVSLDWSRIPVSEIEGNLNASDWAQLDPMLQA